MLQHLSISHYALIEQLEIDWQTHFSVITGETGAGKSIMLGALGLLLGGRAETKAIQMGEKKCTVEASFDISKLSLKAFFDEADIDYDPKECILRREVNDAGKSRAFINDTPVPATKLRELGSLLIDIHSQHQNLLIRNENFLIDTLDLMASSSDLLLIYKEHYRAYREAERNLKQLEERAEKAKNDKEFLAFQLEKLDAAQLEAGEQTSLEQEQKLLAHAEDIKQAFYTAHAAFSSPEQDLLQNLRSAANALQSISENYPNAAELAQRIESASIELEDVVRELSLNEERIEFDPERLNYVQERLNTLYELEQKHHVASEEELISIAEELRIKLDKIECIDDDIQKHREEVERLKKQRSASAEKLTASRKKAAPTVEKELTTSLQQLGMPHVVVRLELTPRTDPNETGADNVQFLFSANKSVPPRDVSQIASGGEIARLMLALKALVAARTQLPTIIFDEIDTGVSGTMAERMAKMMQQIARTCQVICITHLPQIAACGEHHYKVYKEDTAQHTRSHIIPLSDEKRVTEIAHMLSGSQLTEAAINNAKALLQS